VKTISVIILLAISCFVHSQTKTTEEIFRILPSDKIYDLSAGTRDSMLKGKTYYPADNDSFSIIAYNYGVSTNVADYMYVSESYETRQRASGMIEIRSFKTKKGETLVLVSNSSGVPKISYQQNSLDAYIYKNHKLVLYTKNLFLPADETFFMKEGIPDSVRKLVLSNSNASFDFSMEKVTLDLNSTYLTDNSATREWLKGDVVEFTWNGDRFIVSRIYFNE
jgi:hypothetical protein